MQEAAQRMGVSPRTIRRRISEGQLKAYRHGRLIRIDPADLDALEEPVGPDA